MDLMLLRIFQRQVADQCRFALGGVHLINAALGEQNKDVLWVGCQQFLVGAANVSKALWGQRSKFETQRAPLRDSLSVSAESPLKNMTFRNHFEHYDERIDRWWAESVSHNILDQMIGSPSAVQGFESQESFRIYDPGSHTIYFWGEDFAVEPIARELDRVYPLAKSESEKPHWN